MITPEEIEMTTAKVTCRTEDCPNADDETDAPVAVDPAKGTVKCGSCGVEITDIVRSEL